MADARVRRVALGACLLLFGLPLFVGLGNWELQGDEAIYSYAVERILATGDWLTPRYIATDDVFLEKPPLKFWFVAALIELGVLPADESGMRVLDALFGALTFGYVCAFGVRLGGPAAAVTAGLVLFTVEPLLFDHGLRSHNMDAALTLAYSGGLWHAMRWMEGPSPARRQAWFAAAYFVLGFMTKYVAVLLLPVVALAAVIWRPQGLTGLRARAREWLGPAIGATLVSAPWFVYQTAVQGWPFWEQLIGGQVYQRFTTGVDPGHLAPWHYYVTMTWTELGEAGSVWIVAAGLLLVVWRATRRADLVARLVLLWWIVPVTLISVGSSKLPHYVYPYLPPLALGSGLAVTDALRLLARGATPRGLAARLVTVLSTGLVGLAAWTLRYGAVEVSIGGVDVFRNSSAWRPALLAALLLLMVRQLRIALDGAAVVLLVLLLPLGAYLERWQTLRSTNRPLPVLAACVNASRTDRPGVFVADTEALSHTYFYYLRALGPWQTAGDPVAEVRTRILSADPAAHTPVLMHRTTWRRVRSEFGLPPTAQLYRLTDSPLDTGLELSASDVVIVPPAARACVEAAVAAGGRALAPDNYRPPTPPAFRRQ